MKNKFHVFAGDQYYPERGLRDYQGSFPTAYEARSFINLMMIRVDWVRIISHDVDGNLIEVN